MYCGQKLNPVKESETDVAICDCTAPFSVQIVTDALADIGTAAGPNTVDNSRGVCLEWTQIPCQG